MAVPGGAPCLSAAEAADSFTAKAILHADEVLDGALQSAGLGSSSADAPMQTLQAWAEAKSNGAEVFELLELKRRELLLEPIRRNGP